MALQDAGLQLRQQLVWVKDVFVMGRQDYHWRHESVLYGWKKGAAHIFHGGRTQDTVWEIRRPRRRPSYRWYPMLGAACTATRSDGRPCKATPMRDEPFCFWHDPESAEEAADARRLGGLHRRKKKSVAAVYGFGGLRTIGDNQALLETAAIETLAIENSISRNRALAAMAATGGKLIELGDLADRVTALELASRRCGEADDPFED